MPVQAWGCADLGREFPDLALVPSARILRGERVAACSTVG